MFAINAKEKNMKLSETKWDDNTLKTTHQKKLFVVSITNILSKKERWWKLSIKQYLQKTKPYLDNIVYNLRASGEGKIHVTMKINFLSSKDSNEKRLMQCKSDNIKIMIGNNRNKIINELLTLLLHTYQMRLWKSMKGINFVFDHVDGLYYKCNKVSLNGGGSYT